MSERIEQAPNFAQSVIEICNRPLLTSHASRQIGVLFEGERKFNDVTKPQTEVPVVSLIVQRGSFIPKSTDGPVSESMRDIDEANLQLRYPKEGVKELNDLAYDPDARYLQAHFDAIRVGGFVLVSTLHMLVVTSDKLALGDNGDASWREGAVKVPATEKMPKDRIAVVRSTTKPYRHRLEIDASNDVANTRERSPTEEISLDQVSVLAWRLGSDKQGRYAKVL